MTFTSAFDGFFRFNNCKYKRVNDCDNTHHEKCTGQGISHIAACVAETVVYIQHRRQRAFSRRSAGHHHRNFKHLQRSGSHADALQHENVAHLRYGYIYELMESVCSVNGSSFVKFSWNIDKPGKIENGAAAQSKPDSRNSNGKYSPEFVCFECYAFKAQGNHHLIYQAALVFKYKHEDYTCNNSGDCTGYINKHLYGIGEL
ncbi:MAG TPA: hypothetical protein GX505_11815 [Clostridiales bacterium]|nr:hypothetical protein [Clostridiales bacterium]